MPAEQPESLHSIKDIIALFKKGLFNCNFDLLQIPARFLTARDFNQVLNLSEISDNLYKQRCVNTIKSAYKPKTIKNARSHNRLRAAVYS